MVGVSVWNAWVGGVGQNEGKEGPSAECAVGAVGNFRAFHTLKRIVSKIIRGERQLGGLVFKMNCQQRQVVLAVLQIKNHCTQRSRAAKQTRGSVWKNRRQVINCKSRRRF